MIKTNSSLKDYIEVQIDNDSTYPLNLNFSLKKTSKSEAVRGPGIYTITYRNEVIYLGKFQPVGNNNIFNDRWLRHFETLTMRGKRIGFGRNSYTTNKLKKISSNLKNDQLIKLIQIIYNQEGENRFKDTGVVTSINRLRFADENWQKYSSINDTSILSEFKFRLHKINESKKDQSVDKTTNIENHLLRIIHPFCNREFNEKEDTTLRNKNTEEFISENIISAAGIIGTKVVAIHTYS